jgi:aromatic ring-cleaving dioxygenase
MNTQPRKGSVVKYHPIIGGAHDGKLYAVREVGELHGRAVAWLAGKSGCVSIAALTLVTELQEGNNI